MNKTIVSGMLDVDVEKIINNNVVFDNKRKYEVTISSPAGDVPIHFVHNLEWSRDYNSAMGDDIRVIVTIDGAVYRKYIHRNKNHLEATITKLTGSSILSVERYKFLIITNTADNNPDAFQKLTDEQLSSLTPVKIEGQCVDRDLYSLADIDVEGVYKETTIKDVLTAEYLSNIQNINYGEGKPKIQLDFVLPDNTNVYGHINIPTGVKLMGLSKYLQNGERYGVYNCGIGTYLQKYEDKKYIFIYPLLDIKRYESAKSKLMIFHSNNQRVGTGGNTFMIDGKVTKIIPRYNIAVLDRGEKTIVSTGESITYSDPENIFKSYRYIENGVTLKGTKKTNLRTITSKERSDGTIKTTYIGSTNNVYRHRSAVMRNTMAIFQLDWYNCDIDIIYPGMPCEFITEDRYDGLIKLRGVVQSVGQTYLADVRETHGVINIAVTSPEFYRDANEVYKDLNLKTDY